MKVLFIVNIPSPYRVDFFNELGKYCQLTVLYEREYASDREWNHKKAITYEEIFLKGIRVKRDKSISVQVCKYLRKREYDVVVLGGYSTPTGMIATEYMRVHRIPYILNCDGGMVKQDKKIVSAIKKHFISAASAWLSTGNVCNEYLVHYGAQKQNIYWYPFTSIYTGEILKQPLKNEDKYYIREKLGMREKHILLFVGQFIYRKGIDVLLKAVKDISDVGVYIIGGKETDEYAKIVKDLHLTNVYFLPFMQSKEQLSMYYNAADLFVLPTREDIWGLVINEAMAHGLPIITTDTCVAGKEMVENGFTGYLVPSENVSVLHNRILEVVTDVSLQEKMQKNALQIVGQYTMENMANVHVKILEDFLSKKKR